MIWYYSLYGLIVKSTIKLPVVARDEHREPGVIVDIADGLPLPEGEGKRFYFEVGPEFAQFQYRDVALYTISKEGRISVSPLNATDISSSVTTLLGAPFAILLLQRGCSVFHASGIEVGGKAVCFMGRSGAGKSTIACSLLVRGHKLISDDLIILNPSSPEPLAPASGYTWMKISEEASLTLKLPVEHLCCLQKGAPKLKYQLCNDGFSHSPGKLRCIYVPVWGDRFSIERVKSSEAMLYMEEHAYGYVPRPLYRQAEHSRFLQLAELAKTIPCFLITRPRDLAFLPLAAEMIEGHLAQLT